MKWTSTDGTGLPNTVTAIDWAYDNTPGETIVTGAGIAAPEPSTAALLALAGAGAAFVRRRRPDSAR